MKWIKQFENFNERKLSKTDIENILAYFLDLKDEGFYFINKDNSDPLYNPREGELTYSIRRDNLDKEGKDYYNSKEKNNFVGFGLSSSETQQKLKHKFLVYEQLIININIDNSDVDNILNICKNIYSHLVGDDYNCSVWRPSYRYIRFHISTNLSNPFIESYFNA